MAIKELITLEGVAEVEASLKKLAATGEKSLGQFRDLGKATGTGGANPFDKLVDNAKKAGLEMKNFEGHTGKLREAFQILRPILNTAGIQIGEFGAFSRVAAAGMLGLGAALTGSAVVALLSFSEQIANAKQRLIDLTGSSGAGARVFEDLSAAAGKFGVSVKTLLPGFQGFLSALQTAQARSGGAKWLGDMPDAVNKAALAVKGFEALFAALRAGGADTETANKAIAEFLAELRQTGTVTGQMVQKLTDLAPGATKLLAEALGKAGSNAAQLTVELDKSPVAADKAAAGFVRIQKAAEDAFDARKTKTFTENITATGLAVETGAQATLDSLVKMGSGSSDAISGVFSDLNVNATDTFETLQETFNKPIDTSSFTAGFGTSFQTIESLAQALYDRITAIFAQPIRFNVEAGVSPAQNPFGFAGGGMVRGAGSTTSDSILAWLSDKEYVVNARSTAAYLPLLQAINSMSLPRDFISRFSMGGLARAISGNRFAGGGQVRAGNPVILKIDRQTFNMTAGDDTVASLKRFAVAAQLASTGRKPSWVK